MQILSMDMQAGICTTPGQYRGTSGWLYQNDGFPCGLIGASLHTADINTQLLDMRAQTITQAILTQRPQKSYRFTLLHKTGCGIECTTTRVQINRAHFLLVATRQLGWHA